MASYIPITLVGNTLGERHRYLNSLVNDAYQKKVPFQSILDTPEHSAVDRLFKIDIASKLRYTEYILSNLKDDDMLYVSRALRSSWLLEPQYNDVINPAYLDKVLHPEMTTTAVNKMNNWLHVHLKDPSRCLEFFQYYSEKNFDLALKFLWNCPEDVIADAIARAFKKITPKRLKLLSEKCPRAVRKYYYEFMPTKKDISYFDWNKESQYYSSITNLINTDPDLLLDIAEKYYNSNRCSPFSSRITHVIMNNHKDRYDKKPELYAAWLLHTPTLAKCLNNDEIKDIVLRLARAEYLGTNFFSYKCVEPFIQRLSHNERESFKKLVFVDKCIGDKVKDWPYTPPSSPYSERFFERHVFEDIKYQMLGRYHYQNESIIRCGMMNCILKKRSKRCMYQEETLLDKLFNKYRFINFKDTFIELSKLISAESLVQTRQYMMLVLVSKTGGIEDNVRGLLKLLVSRHNNEAENFRATIVRSLVKRAKAWQLPDDLWQLLLKFARGLGLDGKKSDEKCFEGLHAVVLRSILLTEECSPNIFSAYLDQFSTFAEYNLNEEEKRKVSYKLPTMLLASAQEQDNTNEAVRRLEAAMKVFNDYSLKIKDYPETVPVISMCARKDPEACVGLLRKLYDARIARKDLFLENFTFLQNNWCYLNVLRHDAKLLMQKDKFEKVMSEKLEHDQFLRKLAIYFSENHGLANEYLSKIEKEMATNPRADLVRSFAILAGSSLFKKLQEVDRVSEVVKNTAEYKRLVTLRTYGHLARPKLDLFALGWHKAGVKAVANQISICSAKKIEEYMRLLKDWRRAPRLTFLLSERIGKEVEILALIASVRPTVAIKLTFRHLKQQGEQFNPKIWVIGKATLEKSDLSHPKYLHLRDTLSRLSDVPESLRADYCATLYRVMQKVSQEEGTRILVEIEDYLSKADEKFVSDVIVEFLDSEMTFEKSQTSEYQDNVRSCLMLRMIARYLMLCKTEEIQKQRMDTLGKPFLSHMKTFFGKTVDTVSKYKVLKFWNNFMFNLKCTDVFMDTSYVSSLPVLQLIVEWLKESISIVEHIDIYITMHLIMLYFKAIRQSVKQNPVIFANKEERNKLGVEIVGVIFGKYIAHEIVQLKTEYFESIVEIYAKTLNNYLSVAFNCYNSKWSFVSALIRGMLEEHDGTSQLLAEKLYNMNRCFIKDIKGDKTLSILKGIEDTQLKFFLNADLQEIFVD
ncbi:uncharacterized protein LOC128681270 isoform X2 [Plodia interpunctella]|nr:uncharacterized protein LOC128681270 isoform X2 [Plodia interpunctella]XP_053621049.1 uncharacterized protein LOC128681270 isoform X2 [Plodia interpunctella]XP_053621050.1 uncharacterized protein LOC128681270 isoform X2 [Plodia interpunctella]XP_053621051.1 uncharacterized protein LOC128681270 isoform X2 [Plodia interpunctella]XP_053621052.1 uncharacterized protein LOC128681270 isoform X2 [Plodia interpunctella]